MTFITLTPLNDNWFVGWVERQRKTLPTNENAFHAACADNDATIGGNDSNTLSTSSTRV
jgi:hypothetical protein